METYNITVKNTHGDREFQITDTSHFNAVSMLIDTQGCALEDIKSVKRDTSKDIQVKAGFYSYPEFTDIDTDQEFTITITPTILSDIDRSFSLIEANPDVNIECIEITGTTPDDWDEDRRIGVSRFRVSRIKMGDAFADSVYLFLQANWDKYDQYEFEIPLHELWPEKHHVRGV